MSSIFRFNCVIVLLLLSYDAFGQKPIQYNSAEIYEKLERLNTLLSVLYVAAHPDDENQRIISYCNNTLHANTAYLSLTRGDGGQNLIGTERGALLGVLRTQELLGARSIDGGSQYFSRAIDFGYSKNPSETFGFWDKDKVTSDVVRVIRQHRPDIIINRFDHRTPGKTHGHHTASAILSVEVFNKTNDPSVYPDQLTDLRPWQASKIYFNTSWWFYGSREKFAEADRSKLVSVDVGGFYPLRGISNSEIAANARSMHKCQGFGNATTRSSRQEYLELIETDLPDMSKDLTEDINTTWTRVEGGQVVDTLLHDILDTYNFKDPIASLSNLVLLHKHIESTGDPYWKAVKLQELQDIIQSITGLYLEATTESKLVTELDSIEVKIEATNRSDIPVYLKSYTLSNQDSETQVDTVLNNGQESIWYIDTVLEHPSNNHYWINDQMEYGTYSVEDSKIGMAESHAHLHVDFEVEVLGRIMTFSRPVSSMNVLPDQGEIYAPLSIVPNASLSIEDDVHIFSESKAKSISVTVEAYVSDLSGQLTLELDNGWKVSPKSRNISISKLGQTQLVTFEITPPKDQAESTITPVLNVNNQTTSSKVTTVEYAHIPTQTVVIKEIAKAVNIDIKTSRNKKIGYIMGAGDDVPEALNAIGYDVNILTLEQLSNTNLSQYQAILLGIRIYNVNEKINAYQDLLFDYAKNGGTLITQYNTSRRLKAESLAPVPMKLSRDRVSDETADVTILQPTHQVMSWPNIITQSDFEGWVQERGLYFPDEFSNDMIPILSMADKGEDQKLGSLLVMNHGKGHFVYTGLSFFRELPAGVPGAYRLISNIISLGDQE